MEKENVPKNDNPELQNKEESPNIGSPKISSAIKNSSNHKKFLIVIISIIIIAAIIFSLKTNNSVTNNVIQEDVAALVNGEVIKLSDLDKAYNSLPPQYQLSMKKGDLLNQMIQGEVIYQEAKKQGLIIDSTKINEKINLLKLSSGLSDEEFSSLLAQQNTTMEEFTYQYSRQLSIQEFINQTLLSKIVMTDDQVKDYYNANKDKFKVGEQVTVKHILIGNNDLTEEEKDDKAKALLKNVTKENFCEYVEKYSTDQGSIQKCGEYTFGKDDPLVEEFKNFSFSQPIGKIGTVKTQFGTHIIWIVSKAPPKTVKFEEVKDQIKESLMGQQAQANFKDYYDRLKRDFNIEVKFSEL